MVGRKQKKSFVAAVGVGAVAAAALPASGVAASYENLVLDVANLLASRICYYPRAVGKGALAQSRRLKPEAMGPLQLSPVGFISRLPTLLKKVFLRCSCSAN